MNCRWLDTQLRVMRGISPLPEPPYESTLHSAQRSVVLFSTHSCLRLRMFHHLWRTLCFNNGFSLRPLRMHFGRPIQCGDLYVSFAGSRNIFRAPHLCARTIHTSCAARGVSLCPMAALTCHFPFFFQQAAMHVNHICTSLDSSIGKEKSVCARVCVCVCARTCTSL